MKSTYPKRWRATRLDNHKLLEADYLSINRDGYGISNLPPIALIRMRESGILIDITTVYWQCVRCDNWNHAKIITCEKCNCILHRFK